jgi:hypothetical protein
MTFVHGGIHHQPIPQPTKLVHVYPDGSFSGEAICGTTREHTDTDCSREAGCEWCIVCATFHNDRLIPRPYEIRARPFLTLVP